MVGRRMRSPSASKIRARARVRIKLPDPEVPERLIPKLYALNRRGIVVAGNMRKKIVIDAIPENRARVLEALRSMEPIPKWRTFSPGVSEISLSENEGDEEKR